jgi:hypothetical protein
MVKASLTKAKLNEDRPKLKIKPDKAFRGRESKWVFRIGGKVYESWPAVETLRGKGLSQDEAVGYCNLLIEDAEQA